MVSSAVPMRRARHSAGGGREAKRLRPVEAMVAVWSAVVAGGFA